MTEAAAHTTPVRETPRISRAVYAMAPMLMLGPLLTCGIPRIMAPLFLASAFITVIVDSLERRAWPTVDKTLALLFAAFALFGALSALWSLNPDDTVGKAGFLAVCFGGLVMLLPVIGRMSRADLGKIGDFTMIGLGLGLAMYLNEMAHGFPFYENLRGGNSGDVIDNKQNKALVLSSLWLFLSVPLFLMRGGMWERILFFMALVPVAYITSLTHSDSARGVFGAAIIMAVALRFLPVKMSLLLTLAVSTVLVGSMPIATRMLFRDTNVMQNTNISDSIRSRVEIWDQAARRTMEKPVLGWGLDSAPNLPNRNEASYLSDKYYRPMMIRHLHPHNGPLQLWFETGAVGITMLVALFVLFCVRLDGIADRAARKYGIFMWTVVFLYTLSIWGIWQSWFVATLCFAGAMTYAGVRHVMLTAAGECGHKGG